MAMFRQLQMTFLEIRYNNRRVASASHTQPGAELGGGIPVLSNNCLLGSAVSASQ